MSITFIHAIAPAQIMLTAGAALLILAFSYYRFSIPTRKRTRAVLFLLRLFLLGIIFLIILDPYWKRAQENEWIGLLIDRSKSMRVTDKGEDMSRFTQMADFLQTDPYWQELRKNKLKQIHLFGSEITKMESFSDVNADADASKLMLAVKEIDSLYRSDPDLLGFILISDGAATDGNADDKDMFHDLSFPWITIGMGSAQEVPNLEVTAPEIEEHVFVGDIVPLKVNWKSTMPDNLTAKIHVTLDGRPVADKDIDAKAGSAEVSFPLEQPGDHVLDIRIDPLEGEGSTEDNSVRIWFEASLRQIKVFYAESFYKDKNYFKDALEEDADFKVSFVTSLIGFARKHSVPFIKDSLYGLPNTREELFQYDVIVLSDVKRNLLSADQIRWIEELVQKQGGALIMVGGIDSFGDGGYVGTGIERMLPVEISEEYKKENFLAAKGTVENPFRPSIPDEAAKHPILQLVEDKEANAEIWKTMPLLGGYNYVGRLKPGAVLLLKHPVDVSAFGPRVILAAQSFGNGKVLAFTSDVTPNWGEWFQAWHDDKNGWLYAKFWRGAIKWLAENRVRNRTTPLQVHREPALAEEFQPIDFTVIAPEPVEKEGGSLQLDISKEGKSVLFKEFTDWTAQREVTWKANPLEPGDYVFTASLIRKDNRPVLTRMPFTVHPSRTESRHLRSRHELLKQLADKTDGSYLPFSEVSSNKGLEPAIERVRKARLRQFSAPFWNQPWFYVLILAILTLDWLIRKKKGLE